MIYRLPFMLTLLLFAGVSTNANANCTVTKPDGTTYTNTTVSSCKALYDSQHICSTVQGQSTIPCKTLNWIKSPDWDSKQDLVLSAHRGVWGMTVSDSQIEPTDHLSQLPPENSLASMYQAADYNGGSIKVVEMDVVMVRNTNSPYAPDGDGKGNCPPRYDKEEVYYGHYFTYNKFTTSISEESYGEYNDPGNKSYICNDGVDGFVWATNLKDFVGNSRLRGRVGNHPDTTGDFDNTTRFLPFAHALQYAVNASLVVLVDPKIDQQLTDPETGKCIAFCYVKGSDRDALFMKVYSQIVDSAVVNGTTRSVVIKSRDKYSFDHIMQNVPNARQVLWSPQTSKSQGSSQDSVLNAIDAWTPYKKNIAAWDTVIFSPWMWAGKEFTDTRTDNHKTYQSLFDYLKQTTNTRGGIWSLELQGRRGVPNSFQQWKYVGNTLDTDDISKSDMRGDPIYNLSIPYAPYVVLTTDRVDYWTQMVEFIK